MRIIRIVLLFVPVIFLSSLTKAQFYQGYQMDFGKNRVQFNDFLWSFYRFKNFDVYHYLGGNELAVYVGKNAGQDIDEIEKLLDYRTNGRLQFIIYNKLSDLKQTNIGLEGSDMQNNTGGLTRIVGNKIMIYFDGNHEHFHQQIRAGIARVLLDQLMYGGNIKDRLQASVLMQLPDWYTQGLISYISRGWTVDDDNRMRDGVNSGKYYKFNKLLESEEVFAGHSLWKFIVDTYGEPSISNLIYMTRINRSLESGFINILGINLKSLTRNWIDYYQKLYLNSDKDRLVNKGEPLKTKLKPNRIFSQLKVSPDGLNVVYVTNDIGKYKVWLYNMQTGKTKRIDKGGFKSVELETDKSFPVLAWHPTGKYVTIFKEKKGKILMNNYTPSSGKTEINPFLYFEKVLDASYSDDGRSIVFSGIQKGQSDIFVYNIQSRATQQLTKDPYDDLNPRFTDQSSNIIFSSNRPDDSLSVDKKDFKPTHKTFDIFLLDYSSRSKLLKRITDTPDANEMQPLQSDSAHYIYLSDANGIVNRYAATLDSTISFIDTTEHYRYYAKSFPQSDYSRNVEQHDLNSKRTKYAELVFRGNNYRLYINSAPSVVTSSLTPKPTNFATQHLAKVKEQPKTDSGNNTQTIVIGGEQPKQQPVDSTKIDINNYEFQTEFSGRKKRKLEEKKEENKKSAVERDSALADIPTGKSTKSDSSQYLLPKLRNYDVTFSADYFVSQLDNSLLNATYQAYTGGAVYFDPGINGLFKVGISDLFNDYKITGGFRISGDLNSNEYLAVFENLKKRNDQQYVFYRQAREFTTINEYVKIHTHELKYVERFPFNDLASLRGSVSFRTDRIVILSTDMTTLREPNVNQYRASAKLEYVFDNTLNKGLNLYNGLRYKIFAEMFKEVDKPKTNMYVVGADFRYYLKLHRQIIWANRFAASTSFGDQKLIYYLGSTDNALFPSDNFNYGISVDNTQNYVFQTLATNLRGFVQNIRNGNSFALINSELRVPLFQYLINRPIRSDFVRNFQVIGFTDVGTAWTGDSPYGKDNGLNTLTYYQNPVTVTVKTQIEPIVGGFGFGLRSRLLGYFMRADWAWGVDDKEVAIKPLFYFSLGLDF